MTLQRERLYLVILWFIVMGYVLAIFKIVPGESATKYRVAIAILAGAIATVVLPSMPGTPHVQTGTKEGTGEGKVPEQKGGGGGRPPNSPPTTKGKTPETVQPQPVSTTEAAADSAAASLHQADAAITKMLQTLPSSAQAWTNSADALANAAKKSMESVVESALEISSALTASAESFVEGTKDADRQLRDLGSTARQIIQERVKELDAVLAEIATSPRVAVTLRARTSAGPANDAEASTVAGLQPYLNSLINIPGLRTEISRWAADRRLVENIRRHFITLLEQSNDAFGASAAIHRPTSPRMRDWAQLNEHARQNLLGYGPALDRLATADRLDPQSIPAWLAGIQGYEEVALTKLLPDSRNMSSVQSTQQVATYLDNARSTLVYDWLTYLARLYQQLHEALPIEDSFCARRIGSSPQSTTEYQYAAIAGGAGTPINTLEAAAEVLGYQYRHYRLYLADAYGAGMNVSQASRFTYAQWIAGETAREGENVLAPGDHLARVTVPRFDPIGDGQKLGGEVLIVMAGAS